MENGGPQELNDSRTWYKMPWRKYANDFANDLPRWPTDYLESAQLFQAALAWIKYHIHTLPMSRVKVSIQLTTGRVQAAITLGFATHSSFLKIHLYM